MKTVNRWLSMLLVVAMLLSFTGTVAYAADSDLTYAVGSATVDVSTGTKEVTVPVSLTSNALGLVGTVLALEYDDTALTFTGASAIAQDSTITPNTAKNTVTFDRSVNYTEVGEIFSLTFAVKDSARNGDYTVKLAATEDNPSMYLDADGMPVDIPTVSYASGTVTVSGVSAQPQVTDLKFFRTTSTDEKYEYALTLYNYSSPRNYNRSVRVEFVADEGADKTITWTNENDDVAEVKSEIDSNGTTWCYITAKSLGTTTVTATCGDVSKSFKLTIEGPDVWQSDFSVKNPSGYSSASVYLNSDDTEYPTVQLTATARYETSVLNDVQWSSEDESVAKVDQNGLVTFVGMGETKIHVTAKSVSGRALSATASASAAPSPTDLPNITVKKGDVVVSANVSSWAPKIFMPLNQSITLTAEMDKTSFHWMGKDYPFELTVDTDYSGASASIEKQDDGSYKISKYWYGSEAGKVAYIKFAVKGSTSANRYVAVQFTKETNLTQAADGYFLVHNAAELKEFADLVNNTVCTDKIGGQPEKTFNLRLMADIDMTSINDTYIPIGSAINGKFGSYASSRYYSWCGDFDGNHHKIYNIDYTAQSRSDVTLFWNSGVIFTTAGSCHDLTVEGKVQTADNWTTALCGVGQCGKYENVISKLEINAGKASSVSGIGGDDQKATFINCVNYSNITSNSEAKYSYVGGIALEGAVVENCQNYGRLESTNPNAEISGIVRYSRAVGYNIKISQCANYGEIIGGKAAGIVADFEPRGNGSVVDCYNWGEIKGSVYAGGIIGVVDLQAYGNSLKMSGCYNYGTVTGDESSAVLGDLIGKINLGSQTPTNSVERCFYNEDSGNEAIGTIDNSSSIDYTAPVLTAIPQADFATLAEKLGDKFQSSCPAPVFTWQQVKAHEYGTDITYSWHLNSETGVYDACTASVTCTECGSPLTQALTVKRDVARTDCTQERTVTYTATGTINGLAASDTMTDILPAGTHEVDPAQWTGNENTHWHVCANCTTHVDEAAHTGEAWTTDADSHWHVCTVCNSAFGKAAHSGGTATTTKRAQCETCGQEYGELSVPTQDSQGYYLIHNADELIWFRDTVNGGQYNIKARLAANIDMTGFCENWTPIGSYEKPFIGAFDGAGYTISNFNVTVDTLPSDYSGIGLFGTVSVRNGDTIDIGNFTLLGSFSSSAPATNFGPFNVAGVCGTVNNGSVYFHDITVNMTINVPGVEQVGGILGGMGTWGKATIANCRNLGTITGKDKVGGIAGYLRQNSTASDCTNTGAITAVGGSSAGGEAGGIVGYLGKKCAVKRCLNQGVITANYGAGGIVGWTAGDSGSYYCDSDIFGCVNEGAVNGTGSASDQYAGKYTGGIVGQFTGGIIWNCYNTADVTGVTRVGGIIGGVRTGYGYKYTSNFTNGTNVPVDTDLKTYGSIKNAYSTGYVSGESEVGAVAGYIEGYGVFTNVFYSVFEGLEPFGTVPTRDDWSTTSCKVVEPLSLTSADYLTAMPSTYEAYASEKYYFQNSCPAPVITWQEAKSHDYVTGGIQYDWHLNTETGAYDACTASVSCTECGSPLTQALTVKREVARTDCTQERTVTYIATGTINGVAASDTMADILPAGTHEVDPTQWTSDENTHWHVCANCDVRVDEAAHSGGSATTTERARCEICGHEYGELLPRTYTVKFEANGGEGTMDDQIFTYDVAQALTANAFTKTDRTFACWKDANGNTYTDGQTLLNLLTEGTITLTAMWTVNTPALKASYMTSTGKPYIMWNAVSGADKYEVYRSGNSYGTYECIGTATATNYTDSTANAGYTYYYKVKVLTTDGAESDLSAAVAGICHCARPVVTPDYLISTGKPYIKWTAVAGADKYEVYRSGYSNGTYEYVGTTTATNYTDSKANAGYTYYYKVKAISKVSSAANSYYSTIIGATCHCARPVVTPDYLISTGKPYIKWTAVAGASQYEVYRSDYSNGAYEYIGTTTSTNYTDSKANAGYTYYYKVKAVSKVKTAANSYYSAAVAASCHCARPAVKITTSNGSPRLTWDAVAGASQYEIYRATSQNGTYTKMYTTTALSYTNTSAKAGTTYYYKVKAVSKVNSTANSAFSTVVSITAK